MLRFVPVAVIASRFAYRPRGRRSTAVMCQRAPSQHEPVRRRTLIGASDLPYYYEGDEIHDAEDATALCVLGT
jgi:hypothetical protein